MFFWIIAICLMAVLALIGFYQGAIRVAFSFIGLLVAALSAMPLGALLKPILPMIGISHPVLIAFLAPALVYLVILTAFKIGALAVHKKVEAHYEKAIDNDRSLFQRLNSRLGIGLGMANATIYIFLLAVVIYVFGYFAFQVAASEKDSAGLKIVNALCADLEKTGMSKAIAPFIPANEQYYDGADMLGDIFHNPLLQSRLASYPPFLPLAERKEFKTLGSDVKFQQFWMEGHAFGELINHPKLQPLFESADLYTNVVGLLKGDLKDFKGYLETGSSAKYDDEKLLGRWFFNFKDSLGRARRAKPNMTVAELRATRIAFGKLADSTLTAMIDNRAALKMPSLGAADAQTAQGTWNDRGSGNYALSLADKDRKLELAATIESNKLLVTKDSYTLVFEK